MTDKLQNVVAAPCAIKFLNTLQLLLSNYKEFLAVKTSVCLKVWSRRDKSSQTN